MIDAVDGEFKIIFQKVLLFEEKERTLLIVRLFNGHWRYIIELVNID